MEIKDYHNIYFIGIGGIGMSAIARYFNSIGKNVFGYDKTATDLTAKLASEGISISYEDRVELLPSDIDLVIYTPAIPRDHKQYCWFEDNGYPVIKRSMALGMISRSSKCIAVAGTHGKTTTSSLITALLADSEVSFSAFLGGISYDFDSNYVDQGHQWSVVEADEYDRSFLQLDPTIAVLTSMDADHLDIYGDHSVMKQGFWEFVNKIKHGGTLIYRYGIDDNFPLGWQKELSTKNIKTISYGFHSGEAKGSSIVVKDGKFCFDYGWKNLSITSLETALPGRHNIENAIAAMTVCRLLDVSISNIKIALKKFKGIYRRFERMYSDEHYTYIDDYAHHPAEIHAVVDAVRELFPDEKVLGIFQPHLYTRTRDFSQAFAEALDGLDEIWLLPIYPAREEPIEGVESAMIKAYMTNENVRLLADHDDALVQLKKVTKGVILTIGAGDIDLLREPIVKILQNK